MGDKFFFLSYAREDNKSDGDAIKEFFNRLVDELSPRVGGPSEDIGFIDTETIEIGDRWKGELGKALQRCRVFVPIYSSNCFRSPNCGKEWSAFSDRLVAYGRDTGGQPALIVPVLLIRPDHILNIPPFAPDIQFSQASFPTPYQLDGLKLVYKFKRRGSAFDDFVRLFASRLFDVTKAHSLPVSPVLPSWDLTNAAFGDDQTGFSTIDQQPGAVTPEVNGPSSATLIVVAGKRGEMLPIPRRIDFYGPVGGPDWRPYFPGQTEPIGSIAYKAMLEDGLWVEHSRLPDDLEAVLKASLKARRIVVMVVDPWTLRLKDFRMRMKPYDDGDFKNCVVLIPWNLEDEETLVNLDALKDALESALPNKVIGSDIDAFRQDIRTLDDFCIEIKKAVVVAAEKIRRYTSAINRIPSPTRIMKPSIQGPGAF